MVLSLFHPHTHSLTHSLTHSPTHSQMSLLHELFRVQAQAHPSLPAVSDGTRTLSYRELDSLTDRLAARLQELGATVDSCVVIYMAKSIEYVVSYIAILKAGAAYLPMDGESLTHSLTHSLTQSLTHCFTHSLTHCFTHSLFYSLTVLLTHCFTHSLLYSLTSLLTHFFTHSLFYSLTSLLTHFFTHSLTHCFTHSLLY
jgi:non-ribosomal peptide synthetase component F